MNSIKKHLTDAEKDALADAEYSVREQRAETKKQLAIVRKLKDLARRRAERRQMKAART